MRTTVLHFIVLPPSIPLHTVLLSLLCHLSWPPFLWGSAIVWVVNPPSIVTAALSDDHWLHKEDNQFSVFSLTHLYHDIWSVNIHTLHAWQQNSLVHWGILISDKNIYSNGLLLFSLDHAIVFSPALWAAGTLSYEHVPYLKWTPPASTARYCLKNRQEIELKWWHPRPILVRRWQDWLYCIAAADNGACKEARCCIA